MITRAIFLVRVASGVRTHVCLLPGSCFQQFIPCRVGKPDFLWIEQPWVSKAPLTNPRRLSRGGVPVVQTALHMSWALQHPVKYYRGPLKNSKRTGCLAWGRSSVQNGRREDRPGGHVRCLCAHTRRPLQTSPRPPPHTHPRRCKFRSALCIFMK